MKILKPRFPYALLTLLLLCGAEAASPTRAQAQLRTPRPSQKSSVTQTIGVTDVTIVYSRPGVKGRKIWGDAPPTAGTGTSATMDDARQRAKDAPIVPYGRVWRTGANEATTFAVTDDVLINGQKLPAGTYSLHTIPMKDEWTIIFNKDPGQWGSFSYDEKKDALRIKVKPQAAEMQEWFRIDVPQVAPNSAQVVLHWEKVMVPFTVEVPDVMALALAKVRSELAAKPNDARLLLQAANFTFQNKTNMEEGMKWLDESIKVQENYANTRLKARIMAEMGKTQEAIAFGEKAITLGKALNPKPDNLPETEKMVAEWKAKKM